MHPVRPEWLDEEFWATFNREPFCVTLPRGRAVECHHDIELINGVLWFTFYTDGLRTICCGFFWLRRACVRAGIDHKDAHLLLPQEHGQRFLG